MSPTNAPHKNKLLVIGFMPYDENMYPHLYEFLRAMEKHFELTYFGGDDRADDWANISVQLGYVAVPYRSLRRALWSAYSILRSALKILNIRRQIKALLKNRPDIVVAIDHSALYYAALYARPGTALVLWSHDVISPGNSYYDLGFVKRLLQHNLRNIGKYSLIIIQDKKRADLLDHMIGSASIEKHFLPVSLADDDFSRAMSDLKPLRPSGGPFTLMQITASEVRGSDLLLRAWQYLPGDVGLHFQGNVSGEILRLSDASARKPVIRGMSSGLTSMRKAVSEADAGFLCYMAEEPNFTLIAYASGQLVEFLKLGIPVIVYRSKILGAHVKEHECGIYIDDISELGDAISSMRADYARYSKAARKTYQNIYDLNKYIEPTVSRLNSLINEYSPNMKATDSLINTQSHLKYTGQNSPGRSD